MEIFDKLCEFARECAGVRAMLLFGSRARLDNPADEYSDYDLLFFVDDVEFFARGDDWLNDISPVRVSFTEPAAICDIERRVFFSGAIDMDMIFYAVENFERVINHEIVGAWLARGYRVIVDKIGLTERISPAMPRKTPPTQAEFTNLCEDFWFHTLWAMKKLLRGEMWIAKNCIDSYLKQKIVKMLEWRELEADTWHDGRFFEKWAGDDVRRELDRAYGAYNANSLVGALLTTMRLFSRCQHEAARRLGLVSPDAAEAYASQTVDKLSAPIIIRPMSPGQAISKLISQSRGNLRDINHFMKVYAYARAIAECERVDLETMARIEIAAIIHDISVPLCRERFGDTGGKLQESVSRPLVEEFLKDSGYSDEFIARVAYVVSNHHTYNIDGLDHRILIEADYLVNADEGRVGRDNIESALAKVFSTSSGKRFLREMYLRDAGR